jgi:hypothetical protein
VFYLLPKAASYGGDPHVLGFWRKLLGQNVLELDDAEAVCETIALAIGLMEGTIDLRAGIEDLKEYDVDPRTLDTVANTLAHLPLSLATAKSKGMALPGLAKVKSLPAGKAGRL